MQGLLKKFLSNNKLADRKATMAECRRFICSACSKTVESWSDGNPYYIDTTGMKQYAYHPDHERLSLCIANDSPHICLACGKEFVVDSRAPIENCPKCSSHDIPATFELAGKQCPACASGHFKIDPSFSCIS